MTPAQFTRAKLRPLCNHIEDEHGLCFECNADMVTARGGKREGAGRPIEINPANKMVTAKLTQAQYKTWVELGAGRWLKRLLDEATSQARS